MKTLQWVFGSLISLVAFVFVLQIIASERIEVVQLHTFDQQANEVITRLWVVDNGGYQYLS